MGALFAYVAGAIVAVWGVHAVLTRRVLAGSEPITAGNRRIVLQVWLAEAFTMRGIAAVVIVVTAAGGADAVARWWVYRVAAGLLVAPGALTALARAQCGGLVQDLSGAAGWPGRAAGGRELGAGRFWWVLAVVHAGRRPVPPLEDWPVT